MPPLRRNQRPLFDLIGQIPSNGTGSTSSTTPHRNGAESMIEPAPMSPVSATSRTSRGKLTDRAPGDEAAPFDRYASPARSSGSGINVPVNALYIAGAVIVVVAILVWVGGYIYGMKAKQKELEPALRNSVMPTGETAPGNSGNTGSPPPALGTAPGIDPDAVKPKEPAVTGSTQAPAMTGSGTILSIKGLLGSDPRTAGLNYLHIERLPREDAERVIAFFAKNGVETIGVPVERSGKGANNVPLYSVVATKGITGEQYRQKDKARSNLESEVVRLGTVWQREYRGTTNFTRSNWMKYQP